MFRFVVVLAFAAVVLGAPRAPPRKHHKVPLPDGRIVGGNDTEIERVPYQLSLLYWDSHICGASIIDAKWAVTAAHCTDGSSASDLSVRAGSSILQEGGQVLNVKAIHQNPDYDDWNIDNDVSVLELDGEIKLGDSAKPVELQAAGTVIKAGTPADISGWGTVNEGDWDLPTQLQLASVPIVSNEDCAEAYDGLVISDAMLCAGVVGKGGIDACQGDSGGPLVVDSKLSGIVSWGYGCARPEYPGVYGNVSALRTYIDSVVTV